MVTIQYKTMALLRQCENKNVYPCTPKLYYIKVGFEGLFITQTSLGDALKSVKFVRKNIACLIKILYLDINILHVREQDRQMLEQGA